MEPRSDDRGEREENGEDYGVIVASMEPRSDDRGEIVAAYASGNRKLTHPTIES